MPGPTYVDSRPEAGAASSTCSPQLDGTIRASATVHWSDGFVDTASASYSSAGQYVLTTSRNWSFTINVVGPPEGAIGDLTCWTGGGGGPSRWG